MFESFIAMIRPAPLQALLARLTGSDRRRSVSHEGLLFDVDPTSVLGQSLVGGKYEPSMIAVLKRYLHPGGTFVDLGANEGFFSVIGSQFVGTSGQVLAVEPQTRLLPIVLRNLSLNHCFNCRIVQCVVGGRTGQTRLYLSPRTNTGSSSLYPQTRYPLFAEPVQSYSLTDFVKQAGFNSIDLLKVDIEGAEYEVFLEARPVLESGILKNIALEIHNEMLHKRGVSGEELHRFILSCGYELNSELGNWVYESRL